MMMAGRRGSILGLFRWQRDNVVVFVVASTVAVSIYEILDRLLGVVEIGIPTLPLAVVGGALGIFVSFRTNSAYDRWWEGRKLWGRLINTSRHWASQVVSYVPDGPDRTAMVERHIAYVHLLRVLLRKQAPLDDDAVVRWLDDEEHRVLPTQTNQTHYLLARQLEQCVGLQRSGQITELQLHTMDESLRHLLDIQGGCERIKKTPLPPGYGFIAETLIRAFAILFPFAMVEQLSVLAVPLTVLVCLAFLLISEAGRVLEDPFTMFWNGLPLTDMSDTIEHNLRNRLGETELPKLPGPDANGVLM